MMIMMVMMLQWLYLVRYSCRIFAGVSGAVTIIPC